MVTFAMKFQRLLVLGLVTALVLACSGKGKVLPDNPIITPVKKTAESKAHLLGYVASIRIKPYLDARVTGNPYKVGIGAAKVSGMRGGDIVLDQDIATLVTHAMKRSLDETGFQVRDEPESIAKFELTGIIKEFSYNIMARGIVVIGIETSLTEISTGQVLWSGIVIEKNEHIAGVPGNTKGDIADFLSQQLNIVTSKISNAISATLLIEHPEFFSLTDITQPVP